jgi:hypothetical protein
MRCPSGDHVGFCAEPVSPGAPVSFTAPVPSTFTTQMSARLKIPGGPPCAQRRNAMRVPSGLQEGWSSSMLPATR